MPTRVDKKTEPKVTITSKPLTMRCTLNRGDFESSQIEATATMQGDEVDTEEARASLHAIVTADLNYAAIRVMSEWNPDDCRTAPGPMAVRFYEESQGDKN